MSLVRWLLGFFLVLIILLGDFWACGALAYDGPSKYLALGAAALLLVALLFVWPWRRKFIVLGVFFVGVLGWWFTLRPTNTAAWQPDVAQLAWGDIQGDVITLHNVRNCDYRTETDYTPRWETRVVRLDQITGIDLAINYWGSPWIAHPIASFQIANAAPICFSIETRKKVGQSYSAIAGLYRQFALIYVVADERDVIRVRTNYRKGESIYLYRTTAAPAQARQRFEEYVRALNQLRTQPRWYNAITTNCTTSIRSQHPEDERMPWDWRLLLNGKGDQLLYERHRIVEADLPFVELKERALIDTAARAANDAPDFSRRIRVGRPGM